MLYGACCVLHAELLHADVLTCCALCAMLRQVAEPAPGAVAFQPSPLEQKQEKALAALAALDEPLFAVLGSGDIRLLCAAWLLKQPKGWRLERRQDLEAREAAGERPFLTAKQAEAALRKGKRAIAVVSQCAALPQPHFQPRPPPRPLPALTPRLT